MSVEPVRGPWRPPWLTLSAMYGVGINQSVLSPAGVQASSIHALWVVIADGLRRGLCRRADSSACRRRSRHPPSIRGTFNIACWKDAHEIRWRCAGAFLLSGRRASVSDVCSQTRQAAGIAGEGVESGSLWQRTRGNSQVMTAF
jgi:hypothetical protein